MEESRRSGERSSWRVTVGEKVGRSTGPGAGGENEGKGTCVGDKWKRSRKGRWGRAVRPMGISEGVNEVVNE